jgi:integrase
MKISLTSALKSKTPPAGRYSDGRNLYLNVTKTGAKSWVFCWLPKKGHAADRGYQREFGLGSATGDGSTICLGLEEARLAADRVRIQIADGIDPIAARKDGKDAATLAATTFAETLALHIKLNKGDPNNGGWTVKNGVCDHAKGMESKLALHAAKLMGMLTARITVQDIVDVLEPIWAKDVGDRVRDILQRVMQTAINNDHYKGENPVIKALGKLGVAYAGSGKNQNALPFAKLPGVIEQLLGDGRMACIASVFCTLTATRSDEARLMQWEEINWEEKLWTVPAWRMKVKTKKDQAGEHLVPLSDAAMGILKGLLERRVLSNPYVFAGTVKGKSVGDGQLNAMISKTPAEGGFLGLKGDATQHGMRGTFSTWANDSKGFDENDVERCIAHVVGKKVARVYNKAERLIERRAIMQAWGEACMMANVVAFERKAA